MSDTETMIAILGYLFAAIVSGFNISGLIRSRKAKRVIAVIVGAINSLHEQIGDDGKKAVKRAVRRKSFQNRLEKEVHQAVRYAEKKGERQ